MESRQDANGLDLLTRTVNFADILVVVLLVAVGYAGMRKGLLRQLGLSLSLLVGLFALLFAYRRLAFLAEGSELRTVILLLLALAVGFMVYGLSSHIALWLRKRLPRHKHNFGWWERAASSALAVLSAAVMVWLAAAVMRVNTIPFISRQLESSGFITIMNRVAELPAIANTASTLLDPFVGPDVFVGVEPSFDVSGLTISQEFEDLDASIENASRLTLKVRAWGCGSSVSGSGFIVGDNLIATNAHVVAGVDRMSAHRRDGGSFVVRPVWFDPDQDIAILRSESALAEVPLALASRPLAPGAIGAVLGYPDGGKLAADDAIILEYLDATGYDIYGGNEVKRQMYAVRSEVVGGNSGGPLINSAGEVAGMVIGSSSTQGRTGYALATEALRQALDGAAGREAAVGVGRCGARS